MYIKYYAYGGFYLNNKHWSTNGLRQSKEKINYYRTQMEHFTVNYRDDDDVYWPQ